jgi:FixJ family two-component response regulator
MIFRPDGRAARSLVGFSQHKGNEDDALLRPSAQAVLRPAREAIAAEIHTWNEKLSRRELEVCAALLREGSVKNAVRSLAMQVSTFITYRKRAFVKLGIKTSADLARVYEQRQQGQ